MSETRVERFVRWSIYLPTVGLAMLMIAPFAFAMDGRQGLRNVYRTFWEHSPRGRDA